MDGDQCLDVNRLQRLSTALGVPLPQERILALVRESERVRLERLSAPLSPLAAADLCAAAFREDPSHTELQIMLGDALSEACRHSPTRSWTRLLSVSLLDCQASLLFEGLGR